jgi:hypothetical protein
MMAPTSAMRVERIRARFCNNIRGVDYQQAEADVKALLEAHDHYRDDAEQLRREKEVIWRRVNMEDRREARIKKAAWTVIGLIVATVFGAWWRILAK